MAVLRLICPFLAVKWRPWLRPLVYKFIPEVQKLSKTYKSMMKIMTPVVATRLAAIEAGNPSEDMATWNIMNSPPNKKNSIKVQAHTQLALSKAAIYSTSFTGSHILYELATRPEYLAPLRDEVDSVMSTETVPWLTKTSIPKLRLLDSFCKESQRMNPLSPTSFTRKALQDVVLHDGVTIPAGSHISCALAEILRDPEICPNPNSFDGYRHLNLRSQSPEQENRHQFVSTSLDDMSFGYGIHACPGRFFVNNELKVIVTYVLQHYDFKMPEGRVMPGNAIMPSIFGPDMSQVLLLRTRRD
jgi:ent-kaurene oxidase